MAFTIISSSRYDAESPITESLMTDIVLNTEANKTAIDTLDTGVNGEKGATAWSVLSTASLTTATSGILHLSVYGQMQSIGTEGTVIVDLSDDTYATRHRNAAGTYGQATGSLTTANTNMWQAGTTGSDTFGMNRVGGTLQAYLNGAVTASSSFGGTWVIL